MILTEKIKVATLAYWRYIKHHPVGGIECKNADVLTMSRSYMLTESEIKISIADMQREVTTKRYKHLRMKGLIPSLYPKAHYFYFVLPMELRDKAFDVIRDRYPTAGLLLYMDGGINLYKPQNISMAKRSKRFRRQSMSLKELREIAYGVSNTAMRYINKELK